MKAYLAAAAGTVFISVLCSFIVPDGKLKKTVMFLLRIVCLAALVQPVYNLFSFAVDESADNCDYAFICEVYSMQQESAAEDAIYSEFGETCSCDIVIEYSGGEFVQSSITVRTESGNYQLILSIYEYLENSGYININVV